MDLMNDFLKRTWAQIDLNAIRHNYQVIRQSVRPETKICWVVKADGYGHGATFVARELEDMGADWFAVSNLEEAIQLRRCDIKAPILILGYTPPSMTEKLCELGISQTVFSLPYARELSQECTRLGLTLPIHIKVDTGMSRLGFVYQDQAANGDAIDQIEQACQCAGLLPEGIFTHFAVSDEGSDGQEFTMTQFHHFMHVVTQLENRGLSFPIRHCANSGATLDYPETHLDMVRPGIIAYGLLPSQKIRRPLPLIPAMELKTIISMLKTVGPNTPVSYGSCFVTSRQTALATIPIGYADGYPRFLHGKADMLVCGKRAPVVGRVCMDQLMLDVTGIPDAKAGMTVTIFGRDRGAVLSVDELASLNQTINYEMVCIVGKRVPRLYLRDGNPVGQLNYICPPAGESPVSF